jgi:hypothetical protein
MAHVIKRIWMDRIYLQSNAKVITTCPGYSPIVCYVFANKPNKITNKEALLAIQINSFQIYAKIGDICVSMKTEDYLDLPGRISRTVDIELSKEVKAAYDRFEREQVLALAGAGEITAVSAATLADKLLQYANGAIYDQDKRCRRPQISAVGN